jgi:hypothetical protein
MTGARRLRSIEAGAQFDSDDRADRAWGHGDPDDNLDDCSAENSAAERAPLDTARLHADDAFLNRLSNADAGFPGGDSELTSLLMSWRRDVDAVPMPELVSTDEAVHRIADAAQAGRRRSRSMVPLATAAAVLVIAFTGVGIAARNAQPGDALWGLTEVLYSDHAHSVEAADTVRADISHAGQALQAGHLREARTDLAMAQATLSAVAGEDGQAALLQQGKTLLAQINAASTAHPPLPTPQPVTTVPTSSAPTTAPPTTTTVPPTTTTTVPPTTTTVPPTTTTVPTTDQSPESTPLNHSGTPPSPATAPASS